MVRDVGDGARRLDVVKDPFIVALRDKFPAQDLPIIRYSYSLCKRDSDNSRGPPQGTYWR